MKLVTGIVGEGGVLSSQSVSDKVVLTLPVSDSVTPEASPAVTAASNEQAGLGRDLPLPAGSAEPSQLPENEQTPPPSTVSVPVPTSEQVISAVPEEETEADITLLALLVVKPYSLLALKICSMSSSMTRSALIFALEQSC